MEAGTERNRGFAFAEFYNHQAAELAKKTLSPPGFQLRGSTLSVSWAETKITGDQKQEGQQPAQAAIRCIYVGKLPPAASSDALQVSGGLDVHLLSKFYRGSAPHNTTSLIVFIAAYSQHLNLPTTYSVRTLQHSRASTPSLGRIKQSSIPH
eukprot:scaffold532433_cov45-Prasinocladus_malaysianus.AAC.1